MRILLFLFVLGFCSPIVGQSSLYETVKSEVFKDKKKHSQLVFAQEDGDGGLVTVRMYFGGLMRTPKGYYIEHFDKDLKLLADTELEIDKNYIKEILVKDGQLHLVEFVSNKDADTYDYNVLSASLKDLSFSSRNIYSLDEENIKKYFGVGIGVFLIANGLNQMDSGEIGEVLFSEGKNFMVINFDIKDKENATHRVVVFDSNFEQVYDQELVSDTKDRLFAYNDVVIDDLNGAVYFLGKKFESNSTRSKKKGKINYHYELHRLSAQGQEKVAFDSGENFLGSLTLVNKNDRLVCIGLYSEKNKNKFKGVAYYALDPTDLKVTNSSFNAFTDQFMNDKYGKSKDGKELRNISFKGVFMDKNGDVTFTGEEFFITQHTSNSMNGGMRTTTRYHYNDIICAKISSSGEMLWARNINKSQVTLGNLRAYLSFTPTEKEGKVHFFINCSDKLRKLSNDRISFKQAKTKKANLYAIVLDQDGNFEFEKVVDDKDSEVTFHTNDGIVTTDRAEVVFVGSKKKNKQLLKIKL